MRALLVLVSLLVFGTAAAADFRGQDDPRFQAALALWLDDDDETALTRLAALAAGGNRAAQVLLAQIDATPSSQGPWLAGLPRKERNALLRAPGGLSGRSWMQAAAEDTPLARLWVIERTPDATAETALAFAASGEDRAARNTLMALSRRSYRGFAAIADDPNYPPEMRYLIWREWAADPATRALAESEIAALHPGNPQIAHFEFRPVDPAALDDWLSSAPLAGHLRGSCEIICPESVHSCTGATFELLSYGALVMLGPPSETIVTPVRWQASPRGRAALLRGPYTRSPEAEPLRARVAATDACFGAAVAEEAARFAK